MKIEMDTFHPAATKVWLTHSEVIHLAMNLGEEDVNIALGYEGMDYEKTYAEYGSKEGRRRVRI